MTYKIKNIFKNKPIEVITISGIFFMYAIFFFILNFFAIIESIHVCNDPLYMEQCSATTLLFNIFGIILVYLSLGVIVFFIALYLLRRNRKSWYAALIMNIPLTLFIGFILLYSSGNFISIGDFIYNFMRELSNYYIGYAILSLLIVLIPLFVSMIILYLLIKKSTRVWFNLNTIVPSSISKNLHIDAKENNRTEKINVGATIGFIGITVLTIVNIMLILNFFLQMSFYFLNLIFTGVIISIIFFIISGIMLRKTNPEQKVNVYIKSICAKTITKLIILLILVYILLSIMQLGVFV